VTIHFKDQSDEPQAFWANQAVHQDFFAPRQNIGIIEGHPATAAKAAWAGASGGLPERNSFISA
jgi:hypothetical protein